MSNSVSVSQSANLPALRKPPGSIALPDNSQYTNRFEIRSESSDRIYIIAQNIKKRSWSCGCPGWKRFRHCKHLDNLGLPGHEKPYEVLLK